MDTVWLVMENHGYEGTEVVLACPSEEDAQLIADTFGSDYYVDSREVANDIADRIRHGQRLYRVVISDSGGPYPVQQWNSIFPNNHTHKVFSPKGRAFYVWANDEKQARSLALQQWTERSDA